MVHSIGGTCGRHPPHSRSMCPRITIHYLYMIDNLPIYFILVEHNSTFYRDFSKGAFSHNDKLLFLI